MAMSASEPVAFLPLNYLNVTLLDEDGMKNSVATLDARLSSKAVVYLNKPITSGKIFTVEIQYPLRRGDVDSHTLTLGVTTCDTATISNNFYHIQDECNEKFICAGLSRSMPIRYESSGPAIKTIEFTRDSSHLLKITTNGRREFFMKENSGRMAGRTLIPYIVFSGTARRVRITERPAITQSAGRLPLPVHPHANVDQALATSTFRSLWALSNGIDWNGNAMYRKRNTTALYAYFSMSSKAIRHLSFTIKELDATWPGSLSLGVTRTKLNALRINSLPSTLIELDSSEHYKRNWKCCLNPFRTMPCVGDTITIKRQAAGLFLESNASTKMLLFPSSQLANHEEWFLFLYFGGKVSQIEFEIPPEVLEGVQEREEPRPVDCFMSDDCLFCNETTPTYGVRPCGHVILCADCAAQDLCVHCLRCDKQVTGVFAALQ